MVRIRGGAGWRFSGLEGAARGLADPAPRGATLGCVKRLHRPDLWSWSRFDEGRNLDFHSLLWVHPGGNVAIDPLPQSPHDREHLRSLGGVAAIVVTNSDHVRGTEELAAATGARIFGPAGERASFPLPCDRYLADGDEVASGLVALALDGSKTPGELALLLDGSTLITGDLVRAHRGGGLDSLPAAKLADRSAALASLRRLAALPDVDAVLVGDGWPIFRDGARALRELVIDLDRAAR
jgi:Metallo-beta-lactamase superfamily